MNNLPAIKGAVDYANPKTIDTIRATVAVGATDSELEMFLAFCQSTGLNPFKREIWFVKTKGYTKRDGTQVDGRVQIMTGINGFFQIANSNAKFDGMSEPEFEEGQNGLPTKCTVRVYRKDRSHPSVGVARWSEFFPGKTDKGSSLWETKPYHMLAKVAKAIALREAFPQQLNGLYTEEEYREEPVDIEPVHPIDTYQPKTLSVPARSSVKSETAQQAATRALIETGDSWVYGSGLIDVEGAARRALWAQLVKNHGAVTDADGNIHTNSDASIISYAMIAEPGREAKEGVAA